MKHLFYSFILLGILLLLSGCCWHGHLKKCTTCPDTQEVTPIVDQELIADSIDLD